MLNMFNKGSRWLFVHGASIGLMPGALTTQSLGLSSVSEGSAITHCAILATAMGAGSDYILRQNKEPFKAAPVIAGLFLSAALSSTIIGKSPEMEQGFKDWLESPAMRGSVIIAPPPQTYRIR